MEALKLIYSVMNKNGKYLIDYKTFTSTLDQMLEVAKQDNATHANDVFIVILEEFIPTLMKSFSSSISGRRSKEGSCCSSTTLRRSCHRRISIVRDSNT